MKRRAPAEGYGDHGPKRHYRREVWNALSGCCDRESHVLLMPSAEGDEIDVALSKGYHPSRLHVVDDNAAIVANLKRRYPLINTYGVDVVSAGKRIAKKGVAISAANLDLCGSSESAYQTASDFVKTGCLAGRSRIALTMLRGRETSDGLWARLVSLPGFKEHMISGGKLSPGDSARFLLAMLSMAGGAYGVRPVASNRYKSNAGNQTMAWIAIERVTLGWRDELFERVSGIRSALSKDQPVSIAGVLVREIEKARDLHTSFSGGQVYIELANSGGIDYLFNAKWRQESQKVN